MPRIVQYSITMSLLSLHQIIPNGATTYLSIINPRPVWALDFGSVPSVPFRAIAKGKAQQDEGMQEASSNMFVASVSVNGTKKYPDYVKS